MTKQFASCTLVLFLAGAVTGVALAAEINDPGATILQLPVVGDHQLRVLSPQLLELTLITTKAAKAPTVDIWNFIESGRLAHLPVTNDFRVRVGDREVAVTAVGFKRRPVYAPLHPYDLRIGNWLYLQLAAPVADGQKVDVANPDGTLWNAATKFETVADPLRWSPAIHVNQTGYLPDSPKIAMVGFYLGSLGEMDLPGPLPRFQIVSLADNRVVFAGELQLRRDAGFTIEPTPYQKVWAADFSALTNAGAYRLVVPGLGSSDAFVIDEGVAAAWTRAVALGLYHQRCGTNLALPFTRFTHDVCHNRMAEVPTPQFATVERVLADDTADAKKNPRHTAPALKNLEAALYPFVNRGPVDVSGGHHDAGDYSKYTINSAAMIHILIFAADAFPAVSALDNLGLPESQDGKSDILQEAKWEADFLAKLQDADGGFYFLVYPRDRKYESNVPPDEGDPQVVYPKNTSATAAAVAALAQAGSSPAFRREFPEAAARYAACAAKGWVFLERAIAAHGRDGAYQKITHYGDMFMHDDELAWAATEMFVATGNPKFAKELEQHFDPSDRNTRHWTWERLYQGYGCAIRSYAFAARTGRLPQGRLDPSFLARCEAEIKSWANIECHYADQCAYGTGLPDPTKRFMDAGWYFSSSLAFDLATAWQLEPHADWLRAILGNVNFELGNNPVNVSFITGLGTRPAREVVSQFALNSRRRLPPSGLLVGSLQSGFPYLDAYGKDLGALTFPPDGAKTNAYPLYDRWGETFNTKTEAVVVDQARSLATMAFLMTKTSLTNQPWRCATAHITGVPGKISAGELVRLGLVADGLDVNQARVVWETANAEPMTGRNFIFQPAGPGKHWVEAEAVWPDRRRVFAATEISVAAK